MEWQKGSLEKKKRKVIPELDLDLRLFLARINQIGRIETRLCPLECVNTWSLIQKMELSARFFRSSGSTLASPSTLQSVMVVIQSSGFTSLITRSSSMTSSFIEVALDALLATWFVADSSSDGALIARSSRSSSFGLHLLAHPRLSDLSCMLCYCWLPFTAFPWLYIVACL